MILMLLEFTVGNFLSFKDKKTFSLEAGGIKTVLPDNVVQNGKYKVLRSAGIYGANSSGKSNFVKALDFMVNTVKHSSKLNSIDKLGAKPFLLNTETENQPCYFEILFTEEESRYRYGFELDNDKIHSEWLFVLEANSKKEIPYFVRELEGIGVADIFEEAKSFIANTRDNGLFLSLLDQLNVSIAKTVIYNISKNRVISGIDHKEAILMTGVLYKYEEEKLLIESFISKLYLGFDSFKLQDDSNLPFGKKIKTIHKKYNKKGEFISNFEFDLIDQESSGTNKLFDLSGHIVFALMYGRVLIIDELDSKLHPILTQEIIKLFNNPETNPKNAQLIFTTHDTNLLGANLFRRDQIWFTEKDEFESTDLYSLLEFKDGDGKSVRNDRSFEADYIRGRYGAIPYISNLQEI